MSPPPSKRALVTGASKGVGRGIALGLASAGWSVGVNYHSDAAGAEATVKSIEERGGRAWMFKADVGQRSEVDAMFARFLEEAGGIDLLVNNSGVQTWSALLDLEEEDWDRTIRTNLKGTFLCLQAAARIMKESGGGSIINIGSGAHKAPFPNLSDYCASKGGIEPLTTVAAPISAALLEATRALFSPAAVTSQYCTHKTKGISVRTRRFLGSGEGATHRVADGPHEVVHEGKGHAELHRHAPEVALPQVDHQVQRHARIHARHRPDAPGACGTHACTVRGGEGR